LRQANTSAPSAAAAMPANFNAGGNVSQPSSDAYLSNAATPANSTSMPILTGTLPTVNQRCSARNASATIPGREGRTGAVRGGAAAVACIASVTGAASVIGAASMTCAVCVVACTGAATGSGVGGTGTLGAGARGMGAARAGSAVAAPIGCPGAAVSRRCSSATCASSVATRPFRPATETSAITSNTGTASTASTSNTIKPSMPVPRPWWPQPRPSIGDLQVQPAACGHWQRSRAAAMLRTCTA